MDSDTKAIRDWLRQHQISEVECLVPDITGNARGKFIPINQLLSGGEPRLPESIMIQSVTGEYSAEHWDFVEPTDADMILKPDASTVRIVPRAREPTAQIIHDCYTMDGVAHPLASGYLGMKQQLEPTAPHQGTANEGEVEVARTLEEGLRHLQESLEIQQVFGELFLRAFTAVKRDEFEEFNRVISSWEREHLLLQV
jgi:glutamine synthetase